MAIVYPLLTKARNIIDKHGNCNHYNIMSNISHSPNSIHPQIVAAGTIEFAENNRHLNSNLTHTDTSLCGKGYDREWCLDCLLVCVWARNGINCVEWDYGSLILAKDIKAMLKQELLLTSVIIPW